MFKQTEEEMQELSAEELERENFVKKVPFLKIRDEWRKTKTMTHQYKFSTTCTISKAKITQLMKEGDQTKGGFVSLKDIIDDFDSFKEVVDTIVNANHIRDTKRPTEFFIDKLSVRNINVAEQLNQISSVGFAVELPMIQHTNILPYRCVTDSGKKFRCISNALLVPDLDPKNIGTSKIEHVREFNISNGHLVQKNVHMDHMTNQDTHTLIDPSMIFGYHLDECDDIVFKMNTDEMRLKMMHIFDVIRNPYPSEQPKWSKSFDRQTKQKLTQVHLKHDCYPAIWAIDKYVNNFEEFELLGATMTDSEYVRQANNFFNKFSHCRFATFDDAGLFVSVNGSRAPLGISFTLDLTAKFIINESIDKDDLSVHKNKQRSYRALKEMSKTDKPDNAFNAQIDKEPEEEMISSDDDFEHEEEF